MTDDNATPAEKEYLETIFWLEEAGLPMTAANIARAMRLSAPTVHEMVGRLVADRYIERRADKSLEFTKQGRDHAAAVVRKHRLLERFLTDTLGMDWADVHEEAERLENAISANLEERMLTAVGDAKTCPHGHPINVGEREPGVPLADCEEGAQVRVLRFENEAEELLRYLKDGGWFPDLEGTVSGSDADEVRVTSSSGELAVSRTVAETVTVSADPSPEPRTAPPPETLVLAKGRYGR